MNEEKIPTREIGEKFSIGEQLYEVREIKYPSCIGCAFRDVFDCEKVRHLRGPCTMGGRKDRTSVIFVKIPSFTKQEEPTMTKQELYLASHNNSGIEVGDKVRVLRKAKPYEQGWGAAWDEDMDSKIGAVLTVFGNRDKYGFLLADDYVYPWFVLELVEKKPTCPIDLSKYDLGCFEKNRLVDVINDLIDGKRSVIVDIGSHPLIRDARDLTYSLIRDKEASRYTQEILALIGEIVETYHKKEGR